VRFDIIRHRRPCAETLPSVENGRVYKSRETQTRSLSTSNDGCCFIGIEFESSEPSSARISARSFQVVGWELDGIAIQIEIYVR
jgi:hypothetical protein